RIRAVVLATPVAWWLWAAVVESTGWGRGNLALGYAALGLGAVVAAHLGRTAPAARPSGTAPTGTVPSDPPPSTSATHPRPTPRRAAIAVAVAGYVTGAGAVLAV